MDLNRALIAHTGCLMTTKHFLKLHLKYLHTCSQDLPQFSYFKNVPQFFAVLTCSVRAKIFN